MEKVTIEVSEGETKIAAPDYIELRRHCLSKMIDNLPDSEIKRLTSIQAAPGYPESRNLIVGYNNY